MAEDRRRPRSAARCEVTPERKAELRDLTSNSDAGDYPMSSVTSYDIRDLLDALDAAERERDDAKFLAEDRNRELECVEAKLDAAGMRADDLRKDRDELRV